MTGVELLFNGRGREDFEPGLSYLNKGYAAGSSVAARHLAMLHVTGRLVEQGTQQALQYLGEAAAIADASAWAMLDYLYSRGAYGVVRDEYTADIYLSMLKETSPKLASEDGLEAVMAAIERISSGSRLQEGWRDEDLCRADARAIRCAPKLWPGPGGDHGASSLIGDTMITCFIRYELDPTRIEQFRQYARNWGQAIPRCGASLIGYYAPHEGSSTIAYGVYDIGSLAAYETYRARLADDPLGKENYQFAQREGFIRREDRLFLRLASAPHGTP